jgi:hypothetical protein
MERSGSGEAARGAPEITQSCSSAFDPRSARLPTPGAPALWKAGFLIAHAHPRPHVSAADPVLEVDRPLVSIAPKVQRTVPLPPKPQAPRRALSFAKRASASNDRD